MKMQISIEGEALAALNTIVASASFGSRAEARKINTVAQQLRGPKEAYTKDMEAVQDEYGVESVDEKTGKKNKIVPDEKVPAFQKAVEEARLKKYDVEFDKESFSYALTLVDGVFARKEIVDQNGLAGVDQARNMEQISVAFEKAQKVD